MSKTIDREWGWDAFVRWASTIILGVGAYLFWYFGYPYAMGYQEQFQMFLFDYAYLAERMAVPGADGKTLYYMTCLQQDYPLDYKNEKYNLCSIGFDPEKGTFGTKVDTVYNAVSQGKTVTWPRPSYDGRNLMFTQMDYGYFSIWHKESDLWLLDLKTMKAQPLTAANSRDADSYHNCSIGSHWFVFTSRPVKLDSREVSRQIMSDKRGRDNGEITRRQLCHK